MALAPALLEPPSTEATDLDLVELYFEHGWTDGLPVVPPTQDKINAVVHRWVAIQVSSSAKSLRVGVFLPAKCSPST
jgi:hypothetical protein